MVKNSSNLEVEADGKSVSDISQSKSKHTLILTQNFI